MRIFLLILSSQPKSCLHKSWPMRNFLLVGAMSLVLACGCTESPQEKAFYEVKDLEQQYALMLPGLAPDLILRYEEVIQMNPKSKWADKAQQRVDFLQKLAQDDRNAKQADDNARKARYGF